MNLLSEEVVNDVASLMVGNQGEPPNWALDNKLTELGQEANSVQSDFTVMSKLGMLVMSLMQGKFVDPRAMVCLGLHVVDNGRRGPNIDPEDIMRMMYEAEGFIREMKPDPLVARLMSFLGYNMHVFARKGGPWNPTLREDGFRLIEDSLGIVPDPEVAAMLAFERLILAVDLALYFADMPALLPALAALSAGVYDLKAVIDPSSPKLGHWASEEVHAHRFIAHVYAGKLDYPGFVEDMKSFATSQYDYRRVIAEAFASATSNDTERALNLLWPLYDRVVKPQLPTNERCAVLFLIAMINQKAGLVAETRSAYRQVIDLPVKDNHVPKAVAARELAALIDED